MSDDPKEDDGANQGQSDGGREPIRPLVMRGYTGGGACVVFDESWNVLHIPSTNAVCSLVLAIAYNFENRQIM